MRECLTVIPLTDLAIPLAALAAGLVAGRWLSRRPAPPNPWARRTARDWQTLERWTHMGDRDADA